MIATVRGSVARPRHADLQAIAASALDGLEPVVIVNRRIDNALKVLDRPADSTFETIHTERRPGPVALFHRVSRRIQEAQLGTYGEGDLAGRTVYGSVRFVAAADARAGADAILDALQEQGSVGVRSYGPVSFVVDPVRADARTTYAPDDTGATRTAVRPESALAEVLSERLVTGAAGLPTAHELLDLPASAAAQVVRAWLTSEHTSTAGNYLEAQVRGLRGSDLVGSFVTTDDTQPTRIPTIDPGAAPTTADVTRLGELAQHMQYPLRVQ